jgi:hypothetical protein
MKKFLTGTFLIVFFFCKSSFAAPSDSVHIKIECWKINPFLTHKTFLPIDTFLSDLEIAHPAYVRSYSNTHLGNIGLPAISNFYQLRDLKSDFFFIEPYRAYLHKSEDFIYYRTDKPYTNLLYTGNFKAERQQESLQAIHTQNVNEYLNLGLWINLANYKGDYDNQDTKINAFSLFGCYDGEVYSNYSNISIHKFTANENGGLTADTSIFSSSLESSTYPVNLTSTYESNESSYDGCRQVIKNINASFQQRLNLGNWYYSARSDSTTKPSNRVYSVAISHNLIFERDIKSFTNGNVENTKDFFNYIYLDSAKSHDSVYYRSLKNAVFLELLPAADNPVQLGLRVGASNELKVVSYNAPNKYITDSTYVNDYYRIKDHDNTISASIFSVQTKKFTWGSTAQYCFSGYNEGMKSLDANFSQALGRDSFVLFNADFAYDNYRPSYLYKHFFANNFKWENSFQPINRVDWGAELLFPRFGIEGGFKYSLLNKWVYFSKDTMVHPVQDAGSAMVLSIYLKKIFHLGKFDIVNKCTFQKSGNESVHVPEIAAFHSTRFNQMFIRDVLYFQIGYDLYYNTAFYADAYMPGLGVFYNQHEKKTGNYPYLDVFINMRLKRARFFFKFEHVNQGLLDTEYFSAPHYPSGARTFRLGLSWSFID